MEKKTIGKFISALRRAKGLTQRELGDMLYVSGKTVSRWENDECAPDLYLVPTIADIFGISADELLRGERTGAVADAACGARSERQLKGILAGKYGRFRTLSFIPAGLALCSLAVCLATFGTERYFWLGFLFDALFCTAGIICAVCFARSAIFAAAEEYENYSAIIHAHNGDVMFTAAADVLGDVAVLFFCLPVTFFGYNYNMLALWLMAGLLFAAGAVLICFIMYRFCILRNMYAAGTLGYAGEKYRAVVRKRRILAAVWVSAIVAALCLLTGAIWIGEGYAMLATALASPAALLAAAVAHIAVSGRFLKKYAKKPQARGAGAAD